MVHFYHILILGGLASFALGALDIAAASMSDGETPPVGCALTAAGGGILAVVVGTAWWVFG